MKYDLRIWLSCLPPLSTRTLPGPRLALGNLEMLYWLAVSLVNLKRLDEAGLERILAVN